MPTQFHVYDSNEVAVTFLGLPIESGFAEGEFVRVIMSEDAFKSYVGADGNVSRSATHNKMAEIEIRLAQTSPTNDILAAILAKDTNVGTGAGVGVLEIADLQGTSLHSATKAWIVKAPDAVYERDVKERVWKLQAADMNSYVGGSVF